MPTSMAVDQDGSVEKRMNMSLDDIIKETSKVKKGSGPRGKGINVAGKRGKVSGGKKRRCRSVLRLRVQVRQVSNLRILLRAHLLADQVASLTTSQALAASRLPPRSFSDRRQVLFRHQALS